MDNNSKPQTTEERTTPIIDGDARPDLGTEKDKNPKPDIHSNFNKEKGKVTKSRSADVDKTENYKDVKEE